MKTNTYHYFYVLLCRDGSFYGGYTTNPQRRLNEHNAGIGAKYTRIPARLPVQMIYTEKFITRSQATKAEYAFKKLSRAKKIAFLNTHQTQQTDNKSEETAK